MIENVHASHIKFKVGLCDLSWNARSGKVRRGGRNRRSGEEVGPVARGGTIGDANESYGGGGRSMGGKD
ncbi:hypothetical protein ON010_g7057 [Phytophthora cinnamomi]|nr:hypothetical protein ON010_g7057 [Phytophthora cinnamomi]